MWDHATKKVRWYVEGVPRDVYCMFVAKSASAIHIGQHCASPMLAIVQIAVGPASCIHMPEDAAPSPAVGSADALESPRRRTPDDRDIGVARDDVARLGFLTFPPPFVKVVMPASSAVSAARDCDLLRMGASPADGGQSCPWLSLTAVLISDRLSP